MNKEEKREKCIINNQKTYDLLNNENLGNQILIEKCKKIFKPRIIKQLFGMSFNYFSEITNKLKIEITVLKSDKKQNPKNKMQYQLR